MDNIEEMAAQVADHPDYRVLRRFVPHEEYTAGDGAKKAIGLFIDTETTGLNSENDRIIELGMVRFSYSRATGLIYRILEVFTQFEDPDRPIPDNIVALTGITDDLVRGKRIDDEAVTDIAGRSMLVFAHKAAFDRKFMEKRFACFKDKPWACSMADVPWRDEGFNGRSLDYLAYRCGTFFDGHRGDIDCRVGVHILAQLLPISGRTALKALLESAGRTTYRVRAVGDTYAIKDLLKARGYRWSRGDDGRPKGWSKLLEADMLPADEQHYLTSVIGCPAEQLQVDEIDAYNRYSERESS